MDTLTIVLIVVVAVLAVALLAGLAFVRGRERKRAHQQRQAEELRTEAASRQPAVDDARHQAGIAEAEAERRRLEAERAEARAAQARQGLVQEEAQVEDAVRDADRVDPAVDHRAGDYRPTTTDGSTGGFTDEHRPGTA